MTIVYTNDLIAFLLPDPGSIPDIPKFKKLVDVDEGKEQHPAYTEGSVKSLLIDQTHLVLASGKLVQQKITQKISTSLL